MKSINLADNLYGRMLSQIRNDLNRKLCQINSPLYVRIQNELFQKLGRPLDTKLDVRLKYKIKQDLSKI